MTYAYDNADRLTGITQGSAQVGFTYDAASRRSTLTLPNGIVATYTYDTANQLTGINYASGSTVIGDLSYGYDNAGRRTQIGGSLASLTLPAAMASATYDAGNRLTNWAGTALTYDANGSLTGDGSLSYGWDSRKRLVSLTGSSTASFSYDAVGRRNGRTINGTTTNFVYDGANAVQELSGGAPSANLLTGLGIDEVFSRTDNLGTRSFVTDALGSTVALTDGNAAVKTSYAYEPYGNATASGEVNANAAQYTGRENDGTGLYYYRARYYHPGFGRFVSADPIALAGGNNLYSYVDGNPITYADPLGEFGLNLAAAGVGAVIGGVAGATTSYFQGGTLSDIAVAASIGAVGGAVSGFTFGAAGTIAVGAISSGLGNIAGQLATGSNNIDVGQVCLAAAAGATGGVVSLGARAVGESALVEALSGGLATAETQGLFDVGTALNRQSQTLRR